METSNETIRLLQSHRSIRKYKNQPIDEKILEQICYSGFRASTGGNRQETTIIVTRDVERKKKLWELHGEQDMILQAPVLLTFCADVLRIEKWFEVSEAEPVFENFLSFMQATCDTLLVAQNAAVAAESFGLGICYMGTTLWYCDKISEFLECPKSVMPITTLVVGYPDEDPELVDRLPLQAVVHQEKYQQPSAADIKEFYQEKEGMFPDRFKGTSWESIINDNGIKSLAQLYCQIKYKKDFMETASEELLKLIREKRFL